MGYGGTASELTNEKLKSVEIAGKVGAEEMFCKLDCGFGIELERQKQKLARLLLVQVLGTTCSCYVIFARAAHFRNSRIQTKKICSCLNFSRAHKHSSCCLHMYRLRSIIHISHKVV